MAVTLATKATELLRLHHVGGTLVLPTVWDAWSARTMVEAGFPALTVGSRPLANSRGQQDAEGMTLADALDGIRRITASVDVPVSADLESGYDTPPAELVERVLEAGVAGINVEDTVHSEGRLRELQEHADYIAELRAAADEAGVDLVINARTDVFMGVVQKFDDPLAEAVLRLKACEKAGARCVYPMMVPDLESLVVLLDEMDGPVNVLAHPVSGTRAGSLEELKKVGLHRITFGALLQLALTDSLADLIRPWH